MRFTQHPLKSNARFDIRRSTGLTLHQSKSTVFSVSLYRRYFDIIFTYSYRHCQCYSISYCATSLRTISEADVSLINRAMRCDIHDVSATTMHHNMPTTHLEYNIFTYYCRYRVSRRPCKSPSIVPRRVPTLTVYFSNAPHSDLGSYRANILRAYFILE